MIFMKSLRFSSRPRAKVRHQGPLGSTTELHRAIMSIANLILLLVFIPVKFKFYLMVIVKCKELRKKEHVRPRYVTLVSDHSYIQYQLRQH